MIGLLERGRRQNDDLFRRRVAERKSCTLQKRRRNFVRDEPAISVDGGASRHRRSLAQIC